MVKGHLLYMINKEIIHLKTQSFPPVFKRESIFSGGRERTLDARLKPSGMTERERPPSLLSCPLPPSGPARRLLFRPSRPHPCFSRHLPLCHSRRFLAGIHLQREKKKDPGCPIKTVGHDRERGHRPSCPARFLPPVLPAVSSSVLPAPTLIFPAISPSVIPDGF